MLVPLAVGAAGFVWALTAIRPADSAPPRPIPVEPVEPEPGYPTTILIESDAFWHRQQLPERFTCDGEGMSPPLSWTQVPEGTQSLVLLMEDPDVPTPRSPDYVRVHWLLTDIDPDLGGLEEGRVPYGVRVIQDYVPPCPAAGQHGYVFSIYALDERIALGEDPSWPEIRMAMGGHVLSWNTIIGLYDRFEDEP